MKTTANGKLYVVAFNTNHTPRVQLFAYDPAADMWTAKAPPPYDNALYALAESSGSLFLLATASSGSGAISALARYDTADDLWVLLEPLPSRWWSAFTSLNGILYAIGGAQSSGSSATASNRVDVYDPLRRVWTDAGRLQTARNFAATTTLGTDMYVAGGATSGTSDVAVPLSSVESGHVVP